MTLASCIVCCARKEEVRDNLSQGSDCPDIELIYPQAFTVYQSYLDTKKKSKIKDMASDLKELLIPWRMEAGANKAWE